MEKIKEVALLTKNNCPTNEIDPSTAAIHEVTTRLSPMVAKEANEKAMIAASIFAK